MTNNLEGTWASPSDIISNLYDEYDVLWIESHGCVWSECHIDDTDDAYKGDNRDGDEQWYQYRTQGFCSNAAYSLYGTPKGSHPAVWLDKVSNSCRKGHFINSFFTYGGADNLLLSVGQTPEVYYYGYEERQRKQR
ncbi:MAG: hypothetical protein SGARI_007947, partial [Bacillariaceae sp.]